jgi:hypothetical protein
MTHRPDVAGSREIVARWCALAELFESGRWRRYYSERALLENIKEAKLAVETWRALSAPASAERPAMPRPKSVPAEPRRPRWILHAAPAPLPVPIVMEDAAPAEPEADDLPREVAVNLLALESALESPDAPFDISSIERRYPLLRNAL